MESQSARTRIDVERRPRPACPARIARAYLATRSGNFSLAGTELDSCLERWPDDPEVWKSRLNWATAADQVELAREALAHVPARALDPARILEVRAWFARARRDSAAERRYLDALLAIDPGRSSSLARLAELTLQAGDSGKSLELRRKKIGLDAAVDRYTRLYREEKYDEHLDELATLAEQLGRSFEARCFWELARLQSPANAAAIRALSRLDSHGKPPSSPSGSLADLLAGDLEPGGAALERKQPDRMPVPSGFRNLWTVQTPLAWLRSSSTMACPPFINFPRCLAEASGCSISTATDSSMSMACKAGPFLQRREWRRAGDSLFRNRGDGTF